MIMKPLRILLTLLLCLGAVRAQASTIAWGSSIGDQLFTSTGAPLDSSFAFELGTFTTGFTPTELNKTDWAANWKVFDRAQVGDGWDPGIPNLTSEVQFNADGTSNSAYASSSTTFSAGEQAYIWAFNDKSGLEGSEWALITGSSSGGASDTTWKLPVPGGDQATPALQWRLDNASAIVLGGLNDTRGPGDFTSEPPAYELQTSAIPEPGSGLLIATTGLLVSFKRRRR